MLVTEKKVVEMTKEIVEVHAPLILKELGIEDNDGILNRIHVTENYSSETPYGHCNFGTYTKKTGLFDMNATHAYIEGSADIEINPLQVIRITKKNEKLITIPMAMRTLFKSLLKTMILKVLAHELRHYWQVYTGEYYKKEALINGNSLMPYSMRWCEKDANEFASTYRDSIDKVI